MNCGYPGIVSIIIPKLINMDQKGFVNGRFIGDNSRLIYVIINESSNKNVQGLIVLIDFEKAFDSLPGTSSENL